MSNAIRFLEDLACRPTVPDYDALVALVDADPAQRRALLDRNAAALADLLGARTRLHCAVATPSEQDAPLEEPLREDEPAEQDAPDRAS